MSQFLRDEKPKQTAFKASSPYFSQPAKAEGEYKAHFYPFCLPKDFAQENLVPGIRDACLDYFSRNAIKWHDGQNGKPSNHLCDSQVCCVNFLFPFATQPQALASLLNPLFPDLLSMLPVEEGLYVGHEWIGERDYLGEKKFDNQIRTRGANFTSADAIVRFERADGKIQVVLIEWKYTESYYPTSKAEGKSGETRLRTYQSLYDQPDCPLDHRAFPKYRDLFYEPFYQLMRQQFLAHEMEKAHELDADVVSLLHIAPAHNKDFKRITSPRLEGLGVSATDVWGKIVMNDGAFLSVSTEQLFGKFDIQDFPEMRDWWNYITHRYAWVCE